MVYDYVKKHWAYYHEDYDGFEEAFEDWQELQSFNANENIFEIGGYIDDKTHLVMRLATQYHLEEAFKAMKINLDDPNVCEKDATGNIGTPGRIAKIWCGASLTEESELGHGRWIYPPRLAEFPNTNKDNFVIEKTIELTSNCSHHFIPFTTMNDVRSFCTIKYIPNEIVIGISKLSRFVNDYVAKRFWLQEDLTRHIGDAIKKITQSNNVYVRLNLLQHGCERYRGARDSEGGMTTEYKTGYFLDE
jgi:GTP cyclohydrolase I